MIAPRLIVIACLTAAGLPAAGAQEQGSRFALSPTSDGYLLLDSASGAVSECKRDSAGYQCRLVPDERRALQDEIDRLSGENRDLRERLGRQAEAAPESGARTPVPPDEEVDRALGVMEKFIRRFMSIMREDAPN